MKRGQKQRQRKKNGTKGWLNPSNPARKLPNKIVTETSQPLIIEPSKGANSYLQVSIVSCICCNFCCMGLVALVCAIQAHNLKITGFVSSKAHFINIANDGSVFSTFCSDFLLKVVSGVLLMLRVQIYLLILWSSQF